MPVLPGTIVPSVIPIIAIPVDLLDSDSSYLGHDSESDSKTIFYE